MSATTLFLGAAIACALGGGTALPMATEPPDVPQQRRFDVSVSLNIGPVPTGFGSSGDCVASSSSNSFAGSNCSSVTWEFTMANNANPVHKISAGDELVPIVASSSSRCDVVQLGTTRIFNADCYNKGVPGGGTYALQILMVPHLADPIAELDAGSEKTVR